MVTSDYMKDKILSFIIATVTEYMDESINIEYDTDISEININSILFVQLVLKIESEFDVEFDDAMLITSKYKTIGDVVSYVELLLQ